LRLLILAHLRSLARTPLQSLLSVVGIALAVAVVFGVDLALGGARAGFDYAWRQLHGEATHYLAPVAGETFEEARYLEIRGRWREGDPEFAGVRAMTPLVHADATLAGAGTVLLLGIDLVGGMPQSRAAMDVGASWALLAHPANVMLGHATAKRVGVDAGEDIVLDLGSRRVRAHVVALLGTETDPRFDNLVLADIATAQELLGLNGRLHRVELVLGERRTPAGVQGLLERLFPGISRPARRDAQRWEPQLPAGLRVYSVGELEHATRSLTDAFYFNLGALSLLAMLVALFLINQSMNLSVVRRSTQMARMRALGITPRELEGLIVLESLAMGIAGTVVGLVGGWLLADRLLALVTRTVSDLYFVMTVRQLDIDGVLMGKSIALGVAVSVVAAWWPARRAASLAVVEQARRITQERVHLTRRVIVAVTLFAVAWALVRWTESGTVGALGAIGACLLGAAVLTAPLVRVVSFGFALPGPWIGYVGRMSARQLRRNLSRAGVAVAALMIAAATSLGMGIMIDSFRASLDDWLSERLVADVYMEDTSERGFSEGFAGELTSLPGVSGVTLYGSVVELSEGRRVRITVVGEHGASRPRYVLLEGARSPGAVLVSESLSLRERKGVGDSIRLDAPSGEVVLVISGVFRQYGSGEGRVVMDEGLYRRGWGPPPYDVAALFGSGPEFATAIADLEARDGLRLRRQESLRRYSLEIFDRTFTVTEVLRWLALLVAFAGLQSALLALLLDRGREFAVAHALGFTGPELSLLALLDATALGLCAGFMALPVGAAVSWLLVNVVNVRAFGWTIAMSLDPILFVETMLVAGLAGLLAGLTPALRLWRRPPEPEMISREA
jgi:putative ABC transport system permease protein